jgi:hypothetical protein
MRNETKNQPGRSASRQARCRARMVAAHPPAALCLGAGVIRGRE